MKSLQKRIRGIVVSVLLLGSGTAVADLVNGIVDIWTVGVSGQFLCGTATFSPGAAGTSCAAQQMNWGTSTGSGQSGLDISNLPPGQVVTNGGAVANTAITHRNQPITGNSLDAVTLRSTLTLTPFSPPNPTLGSVSLDFLINFQETPNGANPCQGGGANGVGVNVNGCADIFVIDKSSLNFPFFYDLGSGAGPIQYFISFFEQTGGLTPQPSSACTAAGVAAGCLGFRTAESLNTTFNFAAVITTQPVVVSVAAPGTLAALGLGLLLLGAGRRRKAG